jgi:transaldolase
LPNSSNGVLLWAIGKWLKKGKIGDLMNSIARKSTTKVLVDGGDHQETARVKNVIGYVDGQTTNPTLISKNPEVRQLAKVWEQWVAAATDAR